MTRHDTALAAIATAKTTPPKLTRNELIDQVADELRARFGAQRFKALMDVEHRALAHVRAQATAGTVLDPIEQILAEKGYPTTGKVGGVMDVLAFTKDGDLHELACYCHMEAYTGDVIADRLVARKS